MPIFILLFIPLILGMKQLYSWVEPAAARRASRKETLKLARRTSAPGSTRASSSSRAFLYLVFASFVSWRLYGWSLRQDKEGGTELLAEAAQPVARAGSRSSPSPSPSRRSTG